MTGYVRWEEHVIESRGAWVYSSLLWGRESAFAKYPFTLYLL